MSSFEIDPLLLNRKVIITCGTGGVGKTTLSAALAIRGALLGKKVAVITIDPAKRLATSLGMSELSDAPTDLTSPLISTCASLQQSTPQGKLFALIPDTRLTFENFVLSLTSDSKTAQKVMGNPLFKIFAKEFSGTNEYMALEKLDQLFQSNQFDLIVLDTPPSRNTLHFLEAPGLLARFFEDRLIQWLVRPTHQILSITMKKALGLLEKITGKGFMSSLFEFAAALFEVRAKFTMNLSRITELLRSPQVAFLLVSAPSQSQVREIAQFIESIKNYGYSFEGVILNRVLSQIPSNPEKDSSLEYEKGVELISLLREQEKLTLQKLSQHSTIIAEIPELARDVHNLKDLTSIAIRMGSNSVRLNPL